MTVVVQQEKYTAVTELLQKHMQNSINFVRKLKAIETQRIFLPF